MPITALPEPTIRTLGSTQSLTSVISVIKELIDNALDAGATSISIEISPNTLDIIQVKDNGRGIESCDRPLLAKRHCTSKVTNEEEIAQLGGQSLGFRGEALSHVVDMCRTLTVTTRVDGEAVGRVLNFDRAGSVRSERPKSHAIGTTVRVEQFLISHPVRKQAALNDKLRTISKIRSMCQAYTFARSGIRFAFSVHKANKPSEHWILVSRTSDTLKDTAMNTVSQNAASHSQLVEMRCGDVEMFALLPKPGADAPGFSSPQQFISVDGRPLVSSRGVGKVLLDTIKKNPGWCKAVGSGSKYVLVCLKIALLSPGYDVNVEPAKDNLLFDDLEPVLKTLDMLLDSAYPRIAPSAEHESTAIDAFIDQPCNATAVEDSFDQTAPSNVVNHQQQSQSDKYSQSRSTTVFEQEELPSQLRERHLEAYSPWIVAKINSKLASKKTEIQNASHSRIASVDKPALGLLTPDSSPIRKMQMNDRRTIPTVWSIELSTEVGTIPRGITNTSGGATSPGKVSPVVTAPTRSTLDEVVRLSHGPDLISTPSVREPRPIKSPEKRNPRKTFKSPQPAVRDPERDAWFDIPQMRKDERTRQRTRQSLDKRLGPDSSTESSDRTVLSGGKAIDIRSFMKAKPTIVPGLDQEQQCLSTRAEQLTAIFEPLSGTTGQSTDGEECRDDPLPSSQQGLHGARSPLAEIDPYGSINQQNGCRTPHVKSNMKRAKSSMLPLERTPVDLHTQNLTLNLFSVHLIQSQTLDPQHDTIGMVEGSAGPITEKPSLRETLSDTDTAAILKKLRPVLRDQAGRIIEVAPIAGDGVLDVMGVEDEMLL